MYRMKKLKLAVLAGASALLTGCGGSAIDTVKQGSFLDYPQALIGDVFNAAFDNGKWSSSEKGGKTYVTYTGEISPIFHDKIIEEKKVSVYYLFNNDVGFQRKYAAEKNSNRTAVMGKFDELKSIVVNHGKKVGKFRDQLGYLDKVTDKSISELKAMVGADVFNLYAHCKGLSSFSIPKEDVAKFKSLAAKAFNPKTCWVYSDTAVQKYKAEGLQIIKHIDYPNMDRFELQRKKDQVTNFAYRSIENNTTSNEANLAAEKLKTFDEQKLIDEVGEKNKKSKSNLLNEYTKTICPNGEIVEFSWIVYPDGESFELDSFSSKSWVKLQIKLDSVLKVIYSM